MIERGVALARPEIDYRRETALILDELNTLADGHLNGSTDSSHKAPHGEAFEVTDVKSTVEFVSASP